MSTELKYKTFDELLSDVLIDFSTYNLEGMIEPAQLIKIAQKVNYDLGLKLNKTKEKVIEINKGKAKLPEDFYVLNFAFVCGKYKTTNEVLRGRHTEDILLDPTQCKKCGQPDPTCICEKTFTNDCGTHVQVVEKKVFETRVYEYFERINIKSSKWVDSKCCGHASPWSADIRNGFIYTNIDSANLFINYQGSLEDEEGNLLVLDHPMINEYYEYAIKRRIMENLFLNGEEVSQKVALLEPRYREARNAAAGIVNTPDFKEMYKVWWGNRLAMYDKYYLPFQSHGWI
jgi:hypothetical protein